MLFSIQLTSVERYDTKSARRPVISISMLRESDDNRFHSLSQERQDELVSELKVLSETKAATDRHIAATQKLKAQALQNLLDM